VSSYLILPRARLADAETALLPLLARHGYTLRETRDLGERCLLLIDNPGPSVIATAQSAGADGAAGDWIAAIGPFLYRGDSGPAALRAYLDAFDPEAGLWAETQGHFTLIVHKAGTTHLLCDGLGAHKVYHDPGRTVLSNSFLNVLTLLRRPALDPRGAYVYAWTGACQAGRTFVAGLEFLPANALATLNRDHVSVARCAAPASAPVPSVAGGLAARAEANLAVLVPLVRAGAAASGERVRLSFSGGFDSRLLLGLLRRAGVTPELYVYGGEQDGDVRIARTVANACGLRLNRVDKAARPAPDPAAMPAVMERALVAFDGWRNTGLFDTGADADDRPGRHSGGFWPMNGGLGEIYRNFFNLPGRRTRLDDVVSAFYYGFDPAWGGPAFDLDAYHAWMVEDLAAQLDTDRRSLDVETAHKLYPLFRGRFWTAREAEINQRFGPMLFPYLEHAAIARSADTPADQRLFGRLQMEMIRQADPEVAALPNAYGFRFADGPGPRFKLDGLLSLYRPMWLRRRAARVKARTLDRPAELHAATCAAVLDPACELTSGLFRTARITDGDTLNRVLTMEYLAQRFGFAR
jgi:asparagine synthase (glutamine-hydrolysing)